MRLVLALLLLIFDLTSKAQIKLPSYAVETGAIAGFGKEAPFWMISNQYGVYSLNRYSAFIRGGFSSTLSKEKRFDYSYGIDLLERYDTKSNLSLHQAYVQGKIFCFTVMAGKREEFFGNQDSTLSSGGLVWSRNAAPMPKVAVYVNDYTPVPFTHGFFEFKGGMSHGWFGSNEYVKNYYLHHKYIAFQAGGNWPVHFNYAFHHFAQWGGTSTDPSIGKLPGGLRAFWTTFLAGHGSSSDNEVSGEVTNRQGNHIGWRNFGMDVDLRKYSFNLYWQTFWEDVFGFHWKNLPDGLYGFSLKAKDKNRLINHLTYELVHTTFQFAIRNDRDSLIKGNDNYFNHYIYTTGWTYSDYTIGTPLITSPAIINGGTYEHIRNNKVIAHHFGFEGMYNNFSYSILYTFSFNYGTNNNPFPVKKEQIFVINTCQKKLLPLNCDLEFVLGYDMGLFYGNNLAARIALKKTF